MTIDQRQSVGLSKNKMAILSIKSPARVDDYIMSINSLSPPSHLQQMILASAFKSQGQKNKKIKIKVRVRTAGIHSVIGFSVGSSGSA